MAYKRLGNEKLEVFEKLVLEEKTPEDISAMMGISVSSVHNYKRAMRERGIEIPDVRGKRPQGFEKTHVATFFRPEELESENSTFLEIKVDGVTVRFSNNVKNVEVDRNSIILKF